MMRPLGATACLPRQENGGGASIGLSTQDAAYLTASCRDDGLNTKTPISGRGIILSRDTHWHVPGIGAELVPRFLKNPNVASTTARAPGTKSCEASPIDPTHRAELIGLVLSACSASLCPKGDTV
jgi:hypothetical protein